MTDRSAGDERDVRFGRIMAHYGAALGRLAAGYEADPDERQDLEQEIGLAVWLALPRFRGECSERTFVYRIAHNRALTHRWRRRIRHQELSTAEHVADASAGPEALLDRQRRHERVAAAIRRLPELYRATVILVLEGLSHREAAEVLGTSENNVAVRLTRARKLLREALCEGEER